ncbi:MAG TPA: magnesium/cobalt transporter CorA [Acidobacteriota bacterium]
MPVMFKRRSKKSGLPPGSLVHVGEKKMEKTRITVIDYDQDNFVEKQAVSVEECRPFRKTSTITWINVDGVHEPEVIQHLGECYGIHPLILEDIMTTSQRPKLEDLGDYLFLVVRMMTNHRGRDEEKFEQVSLVVGSNFVLSFQEDVGDVFDQVRDRIRKGKGQMRSQGPDYLAYALLDAVVDGYYGELERVGDEIEVLEDEILKDPKPTTLQQVHRLKRDMIFLRKSIWPLREVIGRLERRESPLIKESTALFLKDVYDHAVQVIDTVETFRDMLSGMLDTYLSSASHRMNEIMKVLTIIATIFIPLTFIVGIYGMNFKFMPELEWRWGYLVIWALIAVVAVIMLSYFKRKKWL